MNTPVNKKLRSSTEIFTRQIVQTIVESGTLSIENGEMVAKANPTYIFDALPSEATIEKVIKEKYGQGTTVISSVKRSEVREFKLSEIWELGTPVDNSKLEDL